MKRLHLLTSAAALLFAFSPLIAVAQDTTTTPTQQQNTQQKGITADAGQLIGKNVKDANGDDVGEIESVMVDKNGKVQSVIMDVSSWLQTQKLVNVPWGDLKMDENNDVIVTSLTKDQATALATYKYSDEALRGSVLTDKGQRYTAQSGTPGTPGVNGQPGQNDPTYTGSSTATTTGTNNNASALSRLTGDEAVTNTDGSVNMSQLLGLDVRNGQNENIGEVGEVILDKGGQVKGVVIDVGGFLGVGARPVFLGWNDIRLTQMSGKTVAMVEMSKDRLQNMPEYNKQNTNSSQ